MKLGVILAAVSILIVVGPIVSIVISYQGNPVAEIVSNIETLTEIIEGTYPTVEYVGYEVTDPESSFRVIFNITNNFNEDLTLNTINFSAYCSQDRDVLLGYGHGEGLPLAVPAGSLALLNLSITYTKQGQMHIETHHIGDTNFYVMLENVLVIMQDVEVELDEIDIGPIEIPQ